MKEDVPDKGQLFMLAIILYNKLSVQSMLNKQSHNAMQCYGMVWYGMVWYA